MIQIWSPEKLYDFLKTRNLPLQIDVYCTKNFSWKELLVNQTDKPTLEVLKNLLKIALVLQGYRDNLFKSPVTITSGWRSQAYNRKIGGAGMSFHTRGMALDFIVKGFSSAQVQKILDNVHKGGLEYANGWTHIDIRGNTVRFDSKNNVYKVGEFFKNLAKK